MKRMVLQKKSLSLRNETLIKCRKGVSGNESVENKLKSKIYKPNGN